MARGTQSKEEITKKILETFPGSFVHEKEIRIPWVENAENLQIKVVLTAAKVNVENGSDNAIPGETISTAPSGFSETAMNAPTNEEKERVANLIKKWNL